VVIYQESIHYMMHGQQNIKLSRICVRNGPTKQNVGYPCNNTTTFHSPSIQNLILLIS